MEELWQPYQNLRLVEPFTGGMAVALGLKPKSALLNDANSHLINFYKQIQKGLEVQFPLSNHAAFYYSLRDKFNALIKSKKHHSKEAASIFYFLIRTGYNGLCRFNSDGEFNVPFGQHKSIRYKNNFFEYKDILKNWLFKKTDFENLKIEGNEFLYADPPYDVQFTKYHQHDFLWDDQIRLANWLAKHKGPVIASNQATDRVIKLYKSLKFEIFTLYAPRSISCNGDRTPALEMLAMKKCRKDCIKKIQKTIQFNHFKLQKLT